MTIEQFPYNDNTDFYLSINADTIPTLDNKKPSLNDVISHLDTHTDGYRYALATEEQLTLDENKAVSIAAQIRQWPPHAHNIDTDADPDTPTDILIYVPGDDLIYCAKALINPEHGWLVNEESLLSLEHAIAHIKQNPLNCLIHNGGFLTDRLREQEITINDLALDLDMSGEYTTRWYPSKRHLVLLPAAVLILIATIWLVPRITALLFPPPPPPEPAAVIIEPTRAHDTLARDLLAAARLMDEQALLVIHGLNNITLELNTDHIALQSTGSLTPYSTSERLRRLAAARNSPLRYDGHVWTLDHTALRYPPGDPTPPGDLLAQLDRWRLLATIHGIDLTFDEHMHLHDAEQMALSLNIPTPLPALVRALAYDVHRRGLIAETTAITLRPNQAYDPALLNNPWGSLHLEFHIIGQSNQDE